MSYNINFDNTFTNTNNRYIISPNDDMINSIPISNMINHITTNSPILTNNSITVLEQESFMHLLYDLIHIGVAFSSLEFRVDNYEQKYDLKVLLNTRMKNERYSDSYDYPLAKVVCQDCGFGNDWTNFFDTKLKTIKYLISKGANSNLLTEKYKNEDIDYEYLLNRGIINKEIYNYLVNL